MHHHTQPTFVFLVERRFHHVGQPGLHLLTSGDPHTWASQSAEITGMSHRSQHAGANVLILCRYSRELLMNRNQIQPELVSGASLDQERKGLGNSVLLNESKWRV